jgi:hypothetical protein
MSRLRHQNVCLYMGVCLEPPCLLMEYCARRSVDALLSQGLKDQRVSLPACMSGCMTGCLAGGWAACPTGGRAVSFHCCQAPAAPASAGAPQALPGPALPGPAIQHLCPALWSFAPPSRPPRRPPSR